MEYYVDNTVSDSGNGTSWSGAWKNFSNINWSAVQPGDTIYISGGPAGSTNTYNETLNVDKGGTAGAPITITGGVDPGHSGEALISGQNTRAAAISVYDKNWVTVSGLGTRDTADAGISVKYAEAGVVIENNRVYTGVGTGSGNSRGFDVTNNVGADAVVVRGNEVSTPTFTDAQTDGIWSADNDGVVFERNKVIQSNSSNYGHNDGIQSFHDYNITIRNNWFEQANSAATDNHGIWTQDARGPDAIKVYNNVSIAKNLTGDANVSYLNTSDWGNTGGALFFNNTIVGGDRALQLVNSTHTQAYDNLVSTETSGSRAVDVKGANNPDPGNVADNLLHSARGPVAYIEGAGNFEQAGFQSLGWNLGGAGGDPLFVNAGAQDFHLQSGSPAVDIGRALPLVGADRDGVARPQGAAPDAGAFEKVAASGGSTNPPPTSPPLPTSTSPAAGATATASSSTTSATDAAAKPISSTDTVPATTAGSASTTGSGSTATAQTATTSSVGTTGSTAPATSTAGAETNSTAPTGSVNPTGPTNTITSTGAPNSATTAAPAANSSVSASSSGGTQNYQTFSVSEDERKAAIAMMEKASQANGGQPTSTGPAHSFHDAMFNFW